MLRSLTRSANRYVTELGLSGRTIRRTFIDLGLHIYKMVIIQKLNIQDYAHLCFWRKYACDFRGYNNYNDEQQSTFILKWRVK